MIRPSALELNHLRLEVRDVATWSAFAEDVLGLEVLPADGDGRVRLRMDGNDHRLVLEPGERDDVVALGWRVADEAAARSIADRLAAIGADVVAGTSRAAEARDAAGLVCAVDPDGLAHELVWGGGLGAAPFTSPLVPGGFVTGEQGFGHVALSVATVDEVLPAFVDGLGLRVSDHIEVDDGEGGRRAVTFLRCGPRHHSVALAPVPSARRLHHLMQQVADLDDLGRAWDRCRALGVQVAADLGRHTNDRMTSFYVASPAGFQVEVGHGGITVDEDGWEVQTYDAASTWGHHAPAA